MINICFVCLGNICRSPMAEFIMKDKVKKLGLEKYFYITSRATSYEEEGNDIYPPAKEMLDKMGISYDRHFSKRLENVGSYYVQIKHGIPFQTTKKITGNKAKDFPCCEKHSSARRL